MSASLLEAITNLPAIVQGALGSALFAFALWVARKVYAGVRTIIGSVRHQARIDNLREEIIKYEAFLAKDDAEAAFGVSRLSFHALRKITNAFIWLIAGFIFTHFSSLAAIVPFLFSLYYAFSASNIFYGPLDNEKEETVAEELAALNEKLAQLEDKAKHANGIEENSGV